METWTAVTCWSPYHWLHLILDILLHHRKEHNVTGVCEQQSEGKGGSLLQLNTKKLSVTWGKVQLDSAEARHSLSTWSIFFLKKNFVWLFQELEQYKRNAAKTWKGMHLETWHHCTLICEDAGIFKYLFPSMFPVYQPDLKRNYFTLRNM